MDQKEKENKVLKILIAAVVCLLLITVFLIVVVMMRIGQVESPQENAEQMIMANVGSGAAADISMDSNLTDTRGDLSNRMVYYAGLEDCTVNSSSVVYLENLPENEDIYMSYEISKDGEVIHKTGLIPAGEFSKWTPSEVLSPGVYSLAIKNIPYYDTGDGNYETLAYQPVNVISMTVIE